MNTPLRVLLVNKSEAEAQPILAGLEEFGYTVQSQRVDTPEKLTAALIKHTWDIILSENNLPNFNGLQILRASHKNNADIPIVFISENLSVDDASELVQAGANSCIPKTELHKLTPVIKRELDNADLRKEYKSAGQQIINQSRFPLENPSPVLRVTRDGTIIFHNKASLPILLTWKTGMGKLLPLKWQRLIKEVYESNDIKTTEIECKDKIFLLNIVPIKDADYVNLYATDITERKKSEEALRESEEKYQNLVERANDGICILQDMKIAYLNRRMAQMWGGNVAELTGKNYLDFVHPDSLDIVVNNFKKRMAGSNAPPIYEASLKKKDGTKLYVELNAGITVFNEKPADMVIVRDITERKKAEERLADSERTLKAAQMLGKIGSWETDITTQQITWSDELYELYDRDKTLGPPSSEEMASFFSPEDGKKMQEAVQIVLETGQVLRTDITAHLPNGRTVFQHTAISPIKDEHGKIIKFMGIIQDITERKTAEEQVRFQAELLDSAIDAVFVHDMNDRFIYANQAASQLYGYTREEFLNSATGLLVPKENLNELLEKKQNVIKARQFNFETVHQRKDGSIVPVEIHSRLVEWNGQTLILSIVRNISERKRTIQQLQDSEQRLKEAQSLGKIANYEIDANTLRGTWSDEMYELFERDKNLPAPDLEEIKIYFTPEEFEKYDKITRTAIDENRKAEGDITARLPSGKTPVFHISCRAVRNAQGKVSRTFGTIQDTTEQKMAEENLKESERRLKEAQALGRIANYEINAETLNVIWSEQMYELFECDKNLPPPTVEEIDRYFTPEEFKKFEQIKLAAISKNKEAHGDVIADLPSGKKPVFYISLRPVVNSEGKRIKTFGVIQDITERKKAEEELHKSYTRLSRVLDGVISTMAATIEIRDPYTSGHQQQVARLARAIAEEEGLPDDTVNAIYTSGVIHDIGKIGIPADILSKPGKLNEIEFALIKAHPKIGFDVLKNIEFPYPLAQWVLQHHERMDGSGYPSGLKGEEISKEARILAIADVVESMVSHRPYRPGLGIDVAMEEIEKRKGSLYDAESVDACIRLFKEKGFKLL